MVTAVDDAFELLWQNLRTTPAETQAAKSHRASIEAKLVERFDMQSFFRTGSFGTGTNVAGFSDVDYFAVFPREKLHQKSSVDLTAVADALRDRFPNTPIRVNGPAVRVAFGLDGAEATEIVPVDETGLTLLEFRKFDMPDGNGGWMFTAPPSHNAYVSDVDASLQGMVKPLVRLVKGWKFLRNVPIKSFYLEMRVTKYATTENTIIYKHDVRRVLTALSDELLGDLLDPRFPNDNFYLSACNSQSDRADALSKLANAKGWADAAIDLERKGYIRLAFERWNLVFNGAFPPYG
jgi:hypothetical protein